MRKEQGSPCEKGCGNPINTATGNKFQSESDLSINALLGFTRYYNSQSIEAPHLLGTRWTNTYTRRITAHTGYAYVSRPDGKALLYIDNSGNYTTDADTVGKLERLPTTGTLTGWRFTEKDGRQVENYDAQGRLTSITTTSGESVTLVYNNGVTENNANDFRLTSVTDQQGRSLTFSYTGALLNKITDPAGAEYLYAYDSVSGMLDKVTYPGGKFKLYHYNESANTASTNLPHALTGITDENGDRFATFKYQADGRAISTEHGVGLDKYTVQYGSGSNPGATITTPLGAQETRGFETHFGLRRMSSKLVQGSGSSQSQSTSYDPANGMVDTTTDAMGVVTDYDYSSDGRLLVVQQIDAKSKPGDSNPAEKRTTVTDWHATFALPTERKVYAGTTAGPLMARTVWVYNTRGQVTAQCEIAPGTTFACGGASPPATVRQTLYTYCEQADVIANTCPRVGLLVKHDGPRTDKNDFTTYAYRPSDHGGCAATPLTCQYRKGDLWTVTNALGHVTEIVKYDAAGRVLESRAQNRSAAATGAGGQPSFLNTEYHYHQRGWLLEQVVQTPNKQYTGFEYDDIGQVILAYGPDFDYLTFEYDDAHRLTHIYDPAGNNIEYTLDQAGNRTWEQTNVAGASIVTHYLSRIYNDLGQLVTLKGAANGQMGDPWRYQYTYDANGAVASVAEPLSGTTTNEYDALGRLKKVIANAGGSPSNEVATTQFTNDALDRLTRVTDPKGLNTDYEFADAALGQLTKLTSPDSGISNYAYDSAGNRTSQTSLAITQPTTTEYDALNRVTKVIYPDTSLNSEFFYDLTIDADCGTTTGSYGLGRLTKFTDAFGSTTFCYDVAGNLTRKTQRKGNGTNATNGRTWTTEFEYTDGGRVQKIKYQSGTEVRYGFDDSGRIEAVWVKAPGAAEVQVVDQTSYAPFGPLTQVALTCPSGGTCPWTFDWSYDHDYGISTAVGNSYTLDDNGRISSFSNDQGAVFGIGYDALNRVKNVVDGSANTVRAFTYDATGNRLSKFDGSTTTPYTYATNTHRLTNAGGATRSFDNNGNTTSLNGIAHGYDSRNRLVSVALTGLPLLHALRFEYNARGERMRKWIHRANNKDNVNDRGRYVYDEAGRLLVEEQVNGANVTVSDMVWLDDRPIAMVRGGAIYMIATDHLGTPRAIYNRASPQAVVWRWSLDANVFGESAPTSSGGFVFNMRFPGQVFDAESGLHYNYFRDYEAGTGRYIESDPIGLAGGVSTYAYVGGNPLSYSDPLGLFARDEPKPVTAPAKPSPRTGVRPRGPIGTMVALCASNPIACAAALFAYSPELGADPCEMPGGNCLPKKIEPDCPPDGEGKKCPPCRTISGRIVPVGTVGYRPLDVIPDNVMQHGVYGSHHNIFIANQYPSPKCDCFWQKKSYVLKPGQLPPAAIPVEPFVN